MNGWDLLAMIVCYVLCCRVLRWGYRPRVGCPDKDAADLAPAVRDAAGDGAGGG